MALSSDTHDVQCLGQVFTSDEIVTRMLGMRRNLTGRVLEPSCGNGAFSSRLPGCIAIELDERVAAPGAIVADFFAYSQKEKFDTIIGNPPYVRYRDILPATRKRLKKKLFDSRSNLYLFFIEKCIKHLNPGGELIFITPRDFIKATAARQLNQFIFDSGSITDFIDLGDARIFRNALPNCVIFRFEKGRKDRRMHDGRVFDMQNGQLLFLSQQYSLPFSSLFSVRVGAVSGADSIFTHELGNQEFVCSKTAETGVLRRMIYDIQHPHLDVHKKTLLERRIRQFTEENWWRWGRGHYKSDMPRIYVNCKTRRTNPFFTHPCTFYDGSVLAVFPKDARMDISQATRALNQVAWEELGFVCDGRFLFSQRALESCLLPRKFLDFFVKEDRTKTEG